jgi:hypothetical protein
MTIGQLYNAQNVVVGQAACLVAPANTPLPSIASAVLSDPFSLVPWTAATLGATGPITAGTFILTYTLGGTAYVTTAQTATSVTASTLQAAIVAALAPLAAQSSEVVVAGGPLSTPISFTIALAERLGGGVWSQTPTGITGGTLTLTQPLWVPVGATDQGWTFAANKTTQQITIEEQSTPVQTEITAQTMTITGALSEDISATLAMAFNMTVVTNAPTVSLPGYEQLNMTDNLIEYAVALIMANQKGYPRWLYVPATTCVANVSAALRRAAAKRMYSAEFSSICQTSQIEILNVVAPHS